MKDLKAYSGKEEKGFARVSIITQGNKKPTTKVEDVISGEKHSISYSPETISVGNKSYILKFPLRCLLEKEDNYYVITNELLDIVGTGTSSEEAETNFNEEFDFIYQRYNLPKTKLSNRLKNVKDLLGFYVKEVVPRNGNR
jgi:hypothetical protein